MTSCIGCELWCWTFSWDPTWSTKLWWGVLSAWATPVIRAHQIAMKPPRISTGRRACHWDRLKEVAGHTETLFMSVGSPSRAWHKRRNGQLPEKEHARFGQSEKISVDRREL